MMSSKFRIFLIISIALNILSSIALAQIQSHPLSEITPIDVNLDMFQKNITNVSYLGIGLTSPLHPLDVAGSGRISNNLYIGTAGRYLYDTGSAIGLSSGLSLGGNLNLNSFSLIAGNWINASNFNVSNVICLGGICKSSWPVSLVGGSGTPGYIPLWTASDSLGNSVIYQLNNLIGIGSTSPSYLLEVGKTASGRDVNLSSTLYVNGTAGNVGIGTTSPTYKLDVAGDIRSTGIVRTNTVTPDSGSGVSASGSNLLTMAPYVDNALGFRIPYKVEKWNGTNWEDITTATTWGYLTDGKPSTAIGLINYNYTPDNSRIRLSYDFGGNWVSHAQQLVLYLLHAHYINYVKVEQADDSSFTTNLETRLEVTTPIYCGDCTRIMPTSGFWRRYLRIEIELSRSSGTNYELYVREIAYYSPAYWGGSRLIGSMIPIDWDYNKNVFFSSNVGIGTTSPIKKLDVVGDINATQAIYSSQGYYIGTTQIITSGRVLQNIANVGTNLIPSSDNAYDLGSSSNRWRNVYAVNIYGTFSPSGDVNMQGYSIYNANWVNATNINATQTVRASSIYQGANQVLDTINPSGGLSGSKSGGSYSVYIADGGVTNAKIALNAVNYSQIQQVACQPGYALRVIGGGTYVCEQINATAGVGNVSGSGTTNALAYWTGSSTIGAFSWGSSGQFLKSQGANNQPVWATIYLGTDTEGDYIKNITAGTGIQITGTPGEGWIPTIILATSGVTAGSYGSASQVPQIQVDQYGRITSASNVNIAIDASQITSGTLPVARGGTGASDAATARSNLAASGIGSCPSGQVVQNLTTGSPQCIAVDVNAGDDITGSGSENYIAKFTGTNTIGNSIIYESGGNVGIGTTGPGAKLSVVGPNTGSVPLIDLTATGSGDWLRGVRLLAPNMVAGNEILYAIGKADSARNMGQLYFHYEGDGSTSNRISIGLHSVDDVLNILGTGNVGIGTTSPSSKLEVYGGDIEINDGAATGSYKIKGLKMFYAGDETNVSTTSTTYVLIKKLTAVLNETYGIKPSYINVLARLGGSATTYMNISLPGCVPSTQISGSGAGVLAKASIAVSGCTAEIQPIEVYLKTTSGTGWNDIIEFYYVM